MKLTYQVSVDPPHSPEIERFLEREWNLWHADEGHDPSVSWTRTEIRIVVRDENGEIAGVAVGRTSAGIGHLGELMVTRARRGQGVGGGLVRRFERHCIEAGCHKLTVHTDHGGVAHAFYHRLGWRDEAIFRRDRAGRDFVRLYKYTDELLASD